MQKLHLRKNSGRKIRQGLFYFIILGTINAIFLSCSTNRAIRLRNKSIKEWEEHQWKQVKSSTDKNPQKWTIFSKDVEGSKFKAFKIKGTIHATPGEATKALRFRIENWTEFYTEKEAYFQILENCPEELLVYSIFKLPFPFRDWSMCERFTIKRDRSSGIHKITWHQEWQQAPSEKGTIRMPVARGSWTFVPLDSTKSMATYEVYTEPGGNLPGWMYNSTVRTGLPKELDDIENIVKSTTTNHNH